MDTPVYALLDFKIPVMINFHHSYLYSVGISICESAFNYIFAHVLYLSTLLHLPMHINGNNLFSL